MSEARRTSTSQLIRDGLLEIGDGYRAKNSELGSAGLPFARAQNLNNGFDFRSADHYPEDKLDRVGSKVSVVGDCVFTSKGSVGRIGFVNATTTRFVYSPQLSYWRSLNHAALLPEYLRYWLQAPEFGVQRDAVKGSTDMADYVNLRDQRRMSISIPQPGTQRKIAAVLSAYDELIENNNRRISISEEMAQRIYREWFVDFRYPGHENVPLVRSEGGPVPHGWTVGRVGDIAKVIRGRSYRGTEVGEVGGVPFINLKCIARGGGFRRDGVKRFLGEFRQAHAVRTGDIVMAVTDMTQERRIVARAARIPDLGEPVGVASMDLVRIEPVGVEAEFLLNLLRFSGFADSVKHHANGANVLHLHPDRITQYQTVLPPTRLRGKFAAIVGPLDQLHDALESANASLRRARDLLVPRLISGEIDVEGLDIEIPEAAA